MTPLVREMCSGAMSMRKSRGEIGELWGVSTDTGAGRLCVHWDTQTPSLFFFYLFFYFYHVFIVSRYKKLCAALAIKRTKPINQNKTTKKT